MLIVYKILNSAFLFAITSMLLFLPTTAGASSFTVVFGDLGTGNFNVSGPQGYSISDTVGAVDLGVTALNGGSNCTVCDIHGSSAGFGVDNHNVEGLSVDGPEIDESWSVDSLSLSFSSPVTVTQVVIGGIDQHFALPAPPNPFPLIFYDAGRIENLTASVVLYSGEFSSVGFQTLSFTANNIGTDFLIRAWPSGPVSGDGFRLRELTFSTEIPEPATFVLVGAGFLGIALWRRRRTAGQNRC